MRPTLPLFSLKFCGLIPIIFYKAPNTKYPLTKTLGSSCGMTFTPDVKLTKEECFNLWLLAVSDNNQFVMSKQDETLYNQIKAHSKDSYLSVDDMHDGVSMLHSIPKSAMPEVYKILYAGRVTNFFDIKTAFQTAGITLEDAGPKH